MIHCLYILASLSLFNIALGAAPANLGDGRSSAVDLVQRQVLGTKTIYINPERMEYMGFTPGHGARTVNESKEIPDGVCVFYSYRNATDAEYQFDKDFLKTTPEFSRPTSGRGNVVQFTGCMDKAKYPRQLNPEDEGGVYHNLDGDKATDLSGRQCDGYAWFVECLQPASGQLAVRCCDSKADCPVPGPGERCSDVLRGNYGPCGEAKEPGKEEDGGNDAA